ncbi:MAG: sulfatase-like hydrolase/transferase [Verrucomicrobia bacterium]|nr:sulfatase-like hydrolase/transferase [Verrucomicrobiota bacterium]
MKLTHLLLLCLSLALAMLSLNAVERPNIVLILADDQGWNALSTRMDPELPGSGSTYYQTPRLAEFASQGIRFSRAYSGAPTCSPSRHSIQWGRSASSLGLFAQCPPSWLKAENKDALPIVLKKARPEYVTAHLGKWHMHRTPDELGFDVHDGETGNINGNGEEDPEDPKLIFSLSRRANTFMEEQVQAGRPFFLQISHYADHLQYRAKPVTIEKYKTEHADKATEYQHSPLWAAMNENLDTGVGMVLDKIDELGIADSTYVIYTGDNGFESKVDFWKPVTERTFNKAFPLLSHKYMINEGGLRVPFIVRGPGIPAGASSRTPVIGYDIFPTIMDIVGHLDELPDTVEGGSLLPLVSSGGKRSISRKDPFFVFRYTKTLGTLDIAIVQDDYKLMKEIGSNTVHLWDISEDLGEQKNLINKQPQKAKAMYQAMTEYFNRIGWDESQAAKMPWRTQAKKN